MCCHSSACIIILFVRITIGTAMALNTGKRHTVASKVERCMICTAIGPLATAYCGCKFCPHCYEEADNCICKRKCDASCFAKGTCGSCTCPDKDAVPFKLQCGHIQCCVCAIRLWPCKQCNPNGDKHMFPYQNQTSSSLPLVSYPSSSSSSAISWLSSTPHVHDDKK